MIATLQPKPLDQWRNCLGGRRRFHRRLRPWGSLSYLADGPVIDGLIEIEKLVLVVLYDEPLGHGQNALRLAGFSGKRVPGGVRWGGPDQCRFFKDLLLQPVPDGRGMRLDVASSELLLLGLSMDRQVQCHARSRLPLNRPIRLPRLWAGFRPSDATHVMGDGPELAAACQATNEPADALLRKYRRDHFGLALYPLAWLGQQTDQAMAVFADMAAFPRRRAFQLPALPGDLIGSHEGVEYDLFASRFRRQARERAKPRAHVLAAA